MGGGGNGGGDSRTEYRFAPYIEDRHEEFLKDVANKREKIYKESMSPFKDYSDIDIDPGFFSVGYVLSSFPSLYDMYGKFMAGLDIECLFDQAFKDTTDGTIVHGLIAEQASELSYDLENEIIPRYEVGMSDINAVMSGTFVVGKAMLETKRVKELSKFAAELRYRMIPIATERWKTHLDWNKQVITIYTDILKLYIMATLDVDSHNYEMRAKDRLWPFTVLDYERAALGALTGARDVSSNVAGESPSAAAKALGGAMTGAAAGAMVTPGAPYLGAAVGGIVGLAASFL